MQEGKDCSTQVKKSSQKKEKEDNNAKTYGYQVFQLIGHQWTFHSPPIIFGCHGQSTFFYYLPSLSQNYMNFDFSVKKEYTKQRTSQPIKRVSVQEKPSWPDRLPLGFADSTTQQPKEARRSKCSGPIRSAQQAQAHSLQPYPAQLPHHSWKKLAAQGRSLERLASIFILQSILSLSLHWWCTVLQRCLSRLRRCRSRTGKPKISEIESSSTLLRSSLHLTETVSDPYLLRLDQISPNREQVESEQMENNDRTLKELATPDMVYQLWRRSPQAFKGIPCDRATKDWLYLQPVLFNIWGDMKRIFLEKFFPASRTTTIRKEICGIRQHFGETLHEYWERFNKLCATCPHHQISEQLLIQYFYEGLTMMDRSMIVAASGGALMDKTLAAARHLIFNMARAGQPRMVNEIGIVDNLRLENQLTELTSSVRQLAVGQHQPSIAARSDHPESVGAIGGYQYGKQPYHSRQFDNQYGKQPFCSRSSQGSYVAQ
ncbi:hypothetical protein CR513_41751, partial [Mucuna pruriens]